MCVCVYKSYFPTQLCSLQQFVSCPGNVGFLTRNYGFEVFLFVWCRNLSRITFFFFCAFAITFFFLDYILGNYAPDHILPGLFFWKIFKNKLTWGLASCWILQNFMIDIVYWKLCACSHCAWPVILDNFQNQADIWAFFSVNPAKQVLRHSSFPRHMSVLTWALISFW